jgi:hypothetical protein
VGDEGDDGSATPWILLGLLAVAIAIGGMLLMRRKSPEVSTDDAYRAGADVRDSVSAAISSTAPLDTPPLLARIDAADLTIRNARAAATGEGSVALDRLVLAVAAVRSGVETLAAGAAGAHATDTEGDLLRALAGLDAALGALAPERSGS